MIALQNKTLRKERNVNMVRPDHGRPASLAQSLWQCGRG